MVSTHSRPKAAGGYTQQEILTFTVSTHSRPKAAGEGSSSHYGGDSLFQHTAARRRLGLILGKHIAANQVSTHSRPKAAGAASVKSFVDTYGFNTQPPEGGWRGGC